MVDIHCHILYGLDDGPRSLEESLEMAEMAIADGITHVVATPHSNDHYPFVPKLVRKRQDEILARLGDRLTLVTGCDFHLSFDNLQAIKGNPRKYTINQKSYLLVEFAEYGIPPTIDQTLHELQLAGISPIITHPERNALIRTQPERLDDWIEHGCYVQVTAQSLLGNFGPRARRAVEDWLQGRRIHFFASDAHNATTRPLQLSEACLVVAKRHGYDVARCLFSDNPMAALEGRPLPYVPELPEKDASGRRVGSPHRRKRFIFF